jgi:hypothetical protein
MTDYSNELEQTIQEALCALVKPDTEESVLFIQEVARTAAEAASDLFSELLESVGHLQETVRRLSHLDTGTDNS